MHLVQTEGQTFHVVQRTNGTQNGARRAARVRIAIVVVEVEQTGVRTIVVVAPAFEPRIARVRKVGVYFTVFNLFHHVMKP